MSTGASAPAAAAVGGAAAGGGGAAAAAAPAPLRWVAAGAGVEISADGLTATNAGDGEAWLKTNFTCEAGRAAFFEVESTPPSDILAAERAAGKDYDITSLRLWGGMGTLVDKDDDSSMLLDCDGTAGRRHFWDLDWSAWSSRNDAGTTYGVDSAPKPEACPDVVYTSMLVEDRPRGACNGNSTRFVAWSCGKTCAGVFNSETVAATAEDAPIEMPQTFACTLKPGEGVDGGRRLRVESSGCALPPAYSADDADSSGDVPAWR